MTTLEGQVYRDAMMDGEVKVTRVTERSVVVRDTAILEEEGEEGGSPYPWPMWNRAREEGRFTLVSDSPREQLGNGLHKRQEDEIDLFEEASDSDGADERDEDEDETEDEDLDPEDFTHDDPLSW